MKNFYKIILEDFGYISQIELVQNLFEYQEFISFLSEKLWYEKENKLDEKYIQKNTLLQLNKRIIRVNKMILKFLYNKNSNLCFDIKYQNQLMASDKRAIALSLYRIFLSANASTVISNLQYDLEIFKDSKLLNSLVNIIDHEFITGFKILLK